jgi:hypothetical protein
MKPSKPPALAAWLLERARFSTTDGAIAGDLMEQFNRGRSAAWYWRQVLVAIAVGCISDVRHHSVLAIRAIVITWAVNYGAILLAPAVLSRHRLFGMASHPGLVSFAFMLLGGAASGALVALLHRKHRSAMLLTCAGTLLGWAFIAVVFIKRGALQASIQQIVGVAIVCYLVVLTGFIIGGFLLTPAPKPVSTQG